MARILLVDDQADIRRLLRAVLEGQKHHVITAGNGTEALRIIAENTFDLIITDLIMPETEGLELIRKIRKNDADVKIIAMTGGGYGSATDYLALARAFGVDTTLMKPFSIDEVLTAVTVALG